MEEGGTEIPTLTSLWRMCKNRPRSSLCDMQNLHGDTGALGLKDWA